MENIGEISNANSICFGKASISYVSLQICLEFDFYSFNCTQHEATAERKVPECLRGSHLISNPRRLIL
ncbi:hypothetical protein [Secundilactobacillus kimchicus]|uniref:hypothetical protein n=1 Tax=Secundilactobacillus kimchicus TaxID=528209 RepID=UPI002436D97C|nr:hypothetical protein [Secundilactobacillus kimchicus]